jgi:hypothetical protein
VSLWITDHTLKVNSIFPITQFHIYYTEPAAKVIQFLLLRNT